ncbi:MAG TPA: 23S rRNA (adenine(2030)-N(6))-methyltransferase RlmJ [Caulobacteraceae bacterium]|nr:23S rRNA (adenine(2030)-N(6))-methyltransferase RlmJ [Caulobacteraceae bacterium]
MNYRHAFHAGNHADVFKHAALSLILEHLRRKPAPFAVVDTHAGVGVYDLTSESAQKTREFEAGVGRIFGRDLASAPRYAELLRAMNPAGLATYPGSPEIVRRMLRDDDRLVACELHPAEVAELRARYRSDPRVAVHHRDGYEAVVALTPPPERRGLVLIDPPFEDPDETTKLGAALAAGLRKWPTGVFAAWHPVKDGRIGDLLAGAAAVGGFPKTLRAEFCALPRDGVAMAGGGLLIANAPWKLDEKLEALCRELASLLGDGQASWSVKAMPSPLAGEGGREAVG